MTTATFGCHNLHDGGAKPTWFADILGFTECDAPAVSDAAVKSGRDDFHTQNRTIALVTPKGWFKNPVVEWHRAHDGDSDVPTPARGDLVVYDVEDRSVPACIVSHRINRNWSERTQRPRLRGWWRRRRLWWKHRRSTQAIIRDLKSRGYLVVAMGDMNARPGKDRDGKPLYRAFSRKLMREVGTRLDRIAATPPIAFTSVDYLGDADSDHPRLRATARWSAR